MSAITEVTAATRPWLLVCEWMSARFMVERVGGKTKGGTCAFYALIEPMLQRRSSKPETENVASRE